MAQIQRNINDILILHEELLCNIRPLVARAATKVSGLAAPELVNRERTAQSGLDNARLNAEPQPGPLETPRDLAKLSIISEAFVMAEPGDAAEIAVIFRNLV